MNSFLNILNYWFYFYITELNLIIKIIKPPSLVGIHSMTSLQELTLQLKTLTYIFNNNTKIYSKESENKFNEML